MSQKKALLKDRFRGFLPVVIDIETGGFNAKTDAMLELAAIIVNIDESGVLFPDTTLHFHIEPFAGANMEASALAFNKIDPSHPFRFAVSEKQALKELFDTVKKALKATQCQRAVLVGHNPNFDLSFLHAAVARCQFQKTPFHQFTTFDTATLGAALLGQTVLVKAVRAAGLPFDQAKAHSALYDTERTADLFCLLCNQAVFNA